nr:NAD(P)-binding domain-containing protein [Nocardioides convexus]
MAYRRLGVQALEDLVGAGVNYGAAMTAAREMEDRDVYVVGGGNSAGQAAVHLARFARSVTLLIRREDLAATMSKYLIDEISWNPRITVRPCTEIIDGGADESGQAGLAAGCATYGPARRSGSWPVGCSCSSVPRRTATGSVRTCCATSAASC